MLTTIKRLLAAAVACLLLGAADAAPAEAATDREYNAAKAQKQIQVLKHRKHKHESVLRFWHNEDRLWMLHPNQQDKPCWKVKLSGPLKLCMISRGSVRVHTKELRKVERKLQHLTAPRDTGYLPPAKAVQLGQKMAALKGWVGSQWTCLNKLWGEYESGWYVRADNPTSTAYGIPQALPGSKMGEGWLTSAFVQIRWGLRYIAGRYDTPCKALAFRLANGWY